MPRRGVIIDGAGIGSSIAANKVAGIRAALCYDRASARNSREHNNCQCADAGRAPADRRARRRMFCARGWRRLLRAAGTRRGWRRFRGLRSSMAGRRNRFQRLAPAPASALRQTPRRSTVACIADRSHHAAPGSHPRRYREAVRRSSPIRLCDGLHQSILGAAGRQRTGRHVRSRSARWRDFRWAPPPPKPKSLKPLPRCARARAKSTWSSTWVRSARAILTR